MRPCAGGGREMEKPPYAQLEAGSQPVACKLSHAQLILTEGPSWRLPTCEGLCTARGNLPCPGLCSVAIL